MQLLPPRLSKNKLTSKTVVGVVSPYPYSGVSLFAIAYYQCIVKKHFPLFVRITAQHPSLNIKKQPPIPTPIQNLNLNLFEYKDNIETQTLQQKRFLLEQCKEDVLILDIEAGLSNNSIDWWNLCNHLFILCDGTQSSRIKTEHNLLNILEVALCRNIVENNLLGLKPTPTLLFNWCNTPIPPYWNIPVLPKNSTLKAMVNWIQQRSDTFLLD